MLFHCKGDKHKTPFTAFTVGSLRFFEFEIGFGLVNASTSFQRLMQMAMGNLNLKESLLYLDVMIVFISAFDQHLERLLQQAKLKLQPLKCFLFKHLVKKLFPHYISKFDQH